MMLRYIAAFALAALIAAVVLEVFSPLTAIANALAAATVHTNSDARTGYIIDPRK